MIESGMFFLGFLTFEATLPTIRKELINRKIRTLTDLAIKFGDSAGRKARLDLNLLMISSWIH